jgi:nucleotide-binding universal stress UspA family protein
MFSLEKILAPVDMSKRSVGAVHYAEAVARRFDSEVVLLYVLPPPHYEFSSMEAGGAVMSEMFETRTALVREELEAFLREELPEARTKRLLLEGDPAQTIVEYAHENRFNLIVVPTHGYGVFRRFILGSVAAKILHDADCPVWTGVHLEEAPAAGQIGFKTVVMAADLGAQTAKAVGWASGFAKAYGARLVLIHAVPSCESRRGEYFDQDWQKRLEEQSRASIEKLQEEAGSAAEVVIRFGDAPEVVCSAAKEFGADLLVIGRGSAAGVFGRLRTNAYAIIRQSPCPVVSV